MLNQSPYLKTKGLANYNNTSVSTASPQKLVLLLYDGAVRFLQNARATLKNKEFQAFGENIIKTQRIFLELKNNLNFDSGGDIAINLERLYDFIDFKLGMASIKKNESYIEEVLTVVVKIRSAWAEICIRPGVAQEIDQLRAGCVG